MKKLMLLFCTLSIFGCTSFGTKVTEQQAAQFAPGKTTRDQVIANLGQPNQNMRNADGSSTLVYSHLSMSMNAATFIPIVGALAGGASTSQEMVTFRFDKAGYLIDHSSTNGGSDVSLGLLNR
jgi:outer membrane protein assembly factor BamE (lipoprotein component of BamABCDE complex)